MHTIVEIPVRPDCVAFSLLQERNAFKPIGGLTNLRVHPTPSI